MPLNKHWNDVRVVTTNVGQALQKAMRGIEKANPETLYGIERVGGVERAGASFGGAAKC